jgi:Ca2+-binding EF-hand superfamily protein
MKSSLCTLLVLLLVSTASAQFANDPALKKPPETAPAKPDDKPADPPGIPVEPPADLAAGAAGPNAIFAALDTDGDGTISKLELRKAVASLKKLDANNDDKLTLAECGGGTAAPAGNPTAIAGNGAANPWIDHVMTKDRNNDGKLTPNELTNDEKQMLRNADLNNDGAIDRQELAAMGNNGGVPGGGYGGVSGVNGNPVAGRRGNEAMGRFLQYDRNRDGRLTADEVPQEAVGALQGADSNGDGAIDAAEMQAAIAKMGSRAKAFAGGVDPNAGGNPGAPGTTNPRDRKRAPRNQN